MHNSERRRAQTVCPDVSFFVRSITNAPRPTSKAYVNALTARIELLENMLQELGQTPPPLDAGPFGSAGQPLYAWAQAANGGQKPYTASYGGSNTSVDSVDDGAETAVLQPELAALREPMRHADLDRASPIPEGSWKLNTPLQAVARTLNQEQQDYLMVLYWTKYNHVVNLIPEASFREDQEAGKGLWYSEFLHVCAMAVGSRFVDSAWPGRRKIMSGGRETLIHKIAKDILERGGEKPSGLPMVLALLLLGDLECGVGRLESGWTYGSMFAIFLAPLLSRGSSLREKFHSFLHTFILTFSRASKRVDAGARQTTRRPRLRNLPTLNEAPRNGPLGLHPV